MKKLVGCLVVLAVLAGIVWLGNWFLNNLPHSTPGVYYITKSTAVIPDGEDLVFYFVPVKAYYHVYAQGDSLWVSNAFWRAEYQFCQGCEGAVKITILGTRLFVRHIEGGFEVTIPWGSIGK